MPNTISLKEKLARDFFRVSSLIVVIGIAALPFVFQSPEQQSSPTNIQVPPKPSASSPSSFNNGTMIIPGEPLTPEQERLVKHAHATMDPAPPIPRTLRLAQN